MASDRIYRVVGTDKDGIPVETMKASDSDARRAADEMNARAAKAGRPQDWHAEYADIEWRPIDAQLMEFEQ
ncbi:hypothetical protein [Nocardia sp. NPDC051833]|uniref:hypothetical protein n=1 Tax=Nocardia sp. NPDC051833 TaxID=3155674 RepID=UPI0034495E4B